MLKEDLVNPDNYIYNLLIGACGNVGYTRKAFSLYKMMRGRGLKVTGHTYTGLFNACANSPYPEDALLRAQHLRVTLVERAFLMNQTLYHAMIKAFGRCGDIQTAFELVDEMIEKKIMVTGETFNFLLQACITDKSAGFRQALLVWRKMLDKRVRPSLFSFNLLLRCSRDCGMGDDTSTELVVQVLLQAGQKNSNRLKLTAPSEQLESQMTVTEDSGQNVPNLISPKPTMGDVVVMKRIASPEHRLLLMGGSSGVLDLMEKFNVKPDIKTFTQLLDQIPSTLSAENDLLCRIKQANVPIDCDFCNMLIRKRALRGDYENAKCTLRLIYEEKLKPNMLTFGVLAMACQDLTSARQLLNDIDKFGFRPNIETLGTLVKNACYGRDCDFIIEIMKEVEKVNLKPNTQFLKHLDKFYKFATRVLKEKLTDDTGVLNGEKFDQFVKLYQVWRREMKPDDHPDPWEQFKNRPFESEDLELMKYKSIYRGRNAKE
ncbi:pentatricopeptide repeat-containing protein 1, mitochondrial isoform X2 [Macrosteles quadrilineatus]|nr:pentatricopeptide repeat-containing protein 1, mitochondrial isoform X2 [Macrosteles quadrilineatus]